MRYTIRRSGKVVIKSKTQIVYEYNHDMGGMMIGGTPILINGELLNIGRK